MQFLHFSISPRRAETLIRIGGITKGLWCLRLPCWDMRADRHTVVMLIAIPCSLHLSGEVSGEITMHWFWDFSVLLGRQLNCLRRLRWQTIVVRCCDSLRKSRRWRRWYRNINNKRKTWRQSSASNPTTRSKRQSCNVSVLCSAEYEYSIRLLYQLADASWGTFSCRL